ncbi:MAG TPA: hypothetical protein VNK52_09010 [Hyphomicrobiaceae bacterium]|nr:hypothetical protein [Hyphomicrobiaceae bacterium]
MSKAKAYVCISPAGSIAGGCIVVDAARARHVFRTWLRSHAGCRIEHVALDEAYKSLRPAWRRPQMTASRLARAAESRPSPSPAGHSFVHGRM